MTLEYAVEIEKDLEFKIFSNENDADSYAYELMNERTDGQNPLFIEYRVEEIYVIQYDGTCLACENGIVIDGECPTCGALFER